SSEDTRARPRRPLQGHIGWRRRSSGESDRRTARVKFDEIGNWSEVKLEIVRKYAEAYSTILNRKGLKHYYIDGFAGPGQLRSKTSGLAVPGSPISALHVQPPFKHYFLIDIKGGHVKKLKKEIGARKDVDVLQGDCNDVLLNEVLPKVQWKEFK